MQHSVLDRIYLAFLLILIVSFVFIIFFISFFTRKSLITEKQTTLTNESTLISTQAVIDYKSGNISATQLASYFDYYSETLKSDIWYVDEHGRIIATSGYFDDYSEKSVDTATADRPSIAIMKKLPASIYSLDKDYDIKTNHSSVSNFYGIYSANVISVNAPIIFSRYDQTTNTQTPFFAGALIIHSSTGDINKALRNIYSISFIPCLIIIIIAFSLLQIISHKVIRPIKK